MYTIITSYYSCSQPVPPSAPEYSSGTALCGALHMSDGTEPGESLIVSVLYIFMCTKLYYNSSAYGIMQRSLLRSASVCNVNIYRYSAVFECTVYFLCSALSYAVFVYLVYY